MMVPDVSHRRKLGCDVKKLRGVMMSVTRFVDDSESCRFAGSPFSLPGSHDVVGILKTHRALLIKLSYFYSECFEFSSS